MTAPLKFPPIVAGAGGKSKGSKGTGGGVEAPNSLRSKQTARVVDLISEGPIHGIVGAAKGIYFDGVPLQNANGSWNFSNAGVAAVAGWPDQPVITGFSEQQGEVSVNVQLKKGTPVTRTINNPDVDRCRITISVPALQYTNKDNGDIGGTTVQFALFIQGNGGGFHGPYMQTITGKTNTRYQRSYTIELNNFGAPPWDIRLERDTLDSTVVELQNDLSWDSYTEIIDAKVNYTLSACVGYTIDAEQFQSIPKRVVLVDGVYILIPNNYDPFTRTYSGPWSGTFVYNWCNNPAWVLYDLIRNGRYGIGAFLGDADIDRWSFYKVAQWCDGWVPDGRGAYEPRFVCNSRITSQSEAFDLLNSFASIFRGFVFWTGGQLIAVADQPTDPVGLYTNANVVDGRFTYTGADIRARHNQALVTWNDPTNLGEPRISIVEDQDSISRLGIQKIDVIAIGCTSESQAIRTGKWTLFTENYEAEAVTFSAGLAGAWSRPGDVIEIADATVGGDRRGGRIIAATADGRQVTLDAPVTLNAGQTHFISVMRPDGVIETRTPYLLTPGDQPTFYIDMAFSFQPAADSVWVIASSDLQPTLWRVTSVKQAGGDDYTVEITALRHRPDKWGYVEQNLALAEPDVSNIGLPTVRNLNAIDYLKAVSPISVGVQMLISWESEAPSFDVMWRLADGNWNRVRTDQTAMDVPVVEGVYEIQVTPMNSLGRNGPTAKITYTVIGRYAPPSDPKNFRIQAVQGVAMFQWAPVTDLDVLIGGSFEMRYSPRTSGATWASANIINTSIPGTATTVEMPYRVGTYFLRTRDITGIYSTGWAVVVTSGPDTAYRPFVRICEHPDWLGKKQNTMVMDPQRWLIIDKTGGGLWDDQADAMDDWPTVDVLPVGGGGAAPSEGFYDFDKRIDLGGIFAVRLVRDMLAFPITGSSDDFIDSRAGDVDSWQDWDNAADPGSGMVTTRIRQTNDDPASPSAQWTQWTQFIAGEYTARAFEFQAWLTAKPDENVAIEELCIVADIANKVDEASDVVWVPIKMTILYKVKFYSIPSLSIAIQEGVENDTFRITNKTRESFDLELLTTGGSPITGARTFDWIASGY